jgi:hypothetical protein
VRWTWNVTLPAASDTDATAGKKEIVPAAAAGSP